MSALLGKKGRTMNSLIFKIHNPKTGTSLCASCNYGVVAEGPRNVYVRCTYLAKTFEFEVNNCNRYINRCHPPLSLMLEDAWLLGKEDKKDFGFTKNEKSTWEKGDAHKLAKEIGLPDGPSY